MADANAIYQSSLIIYYSSTLFVLFDHPYYYTDHLSLFYFIFSSHISLLMADANAIYHFSLIMYYSSTHYYSSTLFFTICFCMDDANFTYHLSLIIYYSSTNFLILFFLINTFPPPHFGWLMPCSFSSLFFLSRLTFVQFGGIHSVLSSYAWFILFYFVLPLLGLHIFHHVHPTL